MTVLHGLGCGRDPILEAAEQLEPGGRPGAAGAGPSPGQPVEPPPGQPDQPPEGRAASPPPGVPDEPTPGSPGGNSGPKVPISGEIVLADYDLGKVRIDVFDGDQKQLSGPRPSVVAVLELDRPGPFTVEVPADKEQVWLGAFVDENMDGRPGPQDPSGWYSGNPVATAGGAEGIRIELERQPPPPQKGL